MILPGSLCFVHLSFLISLLGMQSTPRHWWSSRIVNIIFQHFSPHFEIVSSLGSPVCARPGNIAQAVLRVTCWVLFLVVFSSELIALYRHPVTVPCREALFSTIVLSSSPNHSVLVNVSSVIPCIWVVECKVFNRRQHISVRWTEPGSKNL